MEVECEQSETCYKLETYEFEPKDESSLLCFVSNVEQVPTEIYEETLIIEVVEDDDELMADIVDEKSGRNTTPEFELIKPTHIKRELSENVEPECFPFKNDLEFRQEFDDESFTKVQVKDEYSKATGGLSGPRIKKKSFSRQSHFNRHITNLTGKISLKYNTHSPTKQPYSWKTCGKHFAWKRNLKNHVKKLHPEERVDASEESFVKPNRFQFHRRSDHPCKVCPRSFKFQSSLLKHLKEHSLENIVRRAGEDNEARTIRPADDDDDDDEGPFLCDICGQSFSLAKFIRRHKLSHEKPLQCEFCGNRFARHSGLRQHLRSHFDKARFQCDICGKRFLMKSKFLRHKKRHSQEPGSFLCDTCGKLFVTKEGFHKHERIHRKKTFECHVCGQYFSLAEFYHDHMKRHKKRIFKCTLCPLDFTRHEHLKGHMKIHDEKSNFSQLKEDRTESSRTLANRRKYPSRSGKLKVDEEKVPHRCKICSKTFPFKSVLSYHEKSHSKVERFECPVCSKTLKTNLERHMKTHSDERPFACAVCNKAFRIRDQMYKHMKIHAVEPPFVCSICSKGFFSSFALALHRGAHSDGEPYRCKVCDRKFYQMSLLRTHLRQHTGDKPFRCEICEKRFVIKALLGKHQKKNPDKNSFACADCDRRFCFKRDLTVHMTVHNGNRCSFCGKEFHGQYDLNVHMRSHTGETPYECSVCKRRFATKSTRNRHAVLHTEEKPFACRICGKRFRRGLHLKGHMERIHGEGRVSEKPGRVEMAKKRVIIKVMRAKKVKTAAEPKTK